MFLTDSIRYPRQIDYIAQTPLKSQNKACFNKLFVCIKIGGLFKKKEYTHLILDSFDNYAYDIDIGELREMAMKNNIVVIVTKSLSRPPLFSKRNHPVLSDVKFVDKRVQKKFVAYIDIILFLERKPNTNAFKAVVGKDIHNQIGYNKEIEITVN